MLEAVPPPSREEAFAALDLIVRTRVRSGIARELAHYSRTVPGIDAVQAAFVSGGRPAALRELQRLQKELQ